MYSTYDVKSVTFLLFSISRIVGSGKIFYVFADTLLFLFNGYNNGILDFCILCDDLLGYNDF